MSTPKPPCAEPEDAYTSDDEGPTVRLSTANVVALELDAQTMVLAPEASPPPSLENHGDAGPDMPTMRLSTSISPLLVAEESGSSSDGMTIDALPYESLRAALPFLPPTPAAAPAPAAPPKPRAGELPGMLDVALVATIAAELSASSLATVLAAHGLGAERWSAIERHWAARLAGEAERGERALCDAYDEAYLAARALHRGPFGLEAFAELRIELELGAEEPAIPSVASDLADAMRFQRLWTRRAAAEPALGQELEEALGRARSRRASTA